MRQGLWWPPSLKLINLQLILQQSCVKAKFLLSQVYILYDTSTFKTQVLHLVINVRLAGETASTVK